MVWMVETMVGGKWYPVCFCPTRKEARQLVYHSDRRRRVVKYFRGANNER